MKGYVANTHSDWFNFLAQKGRWEEVNFWTPSDYFAFRGELGSTFFFRLKSPSNVIGGFGIVAGYAPLELRQVWENEAQEFTPWLARNDNLAELGRAIGMELEIVGQEQNVGPYRADVLCKDRLTFSVSPLRRSSKLRVAQIPRSTLRPAGIAVLPKLSIMLSWVSSSRKNRVNLICKEGVSAMWCHDGDEDSTRRRQSLRGQTTKALGVRPLRMVSLPPA